MEKKKGFWREVYQRSKEETRGQLPIKWDAVRLSIAIIWAAVAVGISVAFGILQGWDTALFILASLFGGELAVLFALWVSTPIIAFFRLPWVAERVGNEKDSEIKEQKDLVEYLRKHERLGRGDLIEIRKVEEEKWAGIEIYNGEKGNPFNGRVLVVDVTGKTIRNAIEVINSDTQDTSFHAPSEQKATMRLISWFGDNTLPSLASRVSHQIQFPNGEYTITTLMAGSFWSPMTSVEIKNQWKFVVNKEAKIFELEKINEERINNN